MISDLMTDGLLPFFTKTSNGRADVGQKRECFLPLHSSTLHEQIEVFEFIGKLMGIAIRGDYTLPFSFPTLIWKLLLGKTIVQEDLTETDHLCVQAMECLRALSEVDTEPDMILLESYTTTLTDGTFNRTRECDFRR